MKSIFSVSVCLFIELFVPVCFGQKKIAILGSSTAAGNGASVPDSSWVGKLQASFRKNTADGIDTVIDNRAIGGYVTYKSLPTGSHTDGRPDPDPSANVTYVLNSIPRADIVIINYPTNDIVGDYTPKEMMDNLRLMFQQFNANGITCYITTSQPRNTASDPQRTLLRQVVDSIKNNFGNYAINFWDDLVTSDGLNMIRPEVDADGTHPNNYGHRLLFQRVVAKNIFSIGAPLPLTLKNWEAKLQNNSVLLSWSTAQEEPSTSFEIERCDNGVHFETIYQRSGTGHNANYSWTDASPLNGKNFYRLKITELSKTIYSRIIPVVNDKKQFVTSLYADGSQLHLQLQGNTNQSATLVIIDYTGAVLKKQSFQLRGANTNLTIPVSELPQGNYFVRVTSSGGLNTVERFSIMK
jgi:lysophospholipase L1-like esterase